MSVNGGSPISPAGPKHAWMCGPPPVLSVENESTMPTPYKILISVLALIVATLVFYLSDEENVSRWVALALGPFMVFSIWVFPEAKAKEIRREAAKRRSPH